MSLCDVEHYRALLIRQFETYSQRLLAQIPEVQTSTYIIIVLSICIPPILALAFFEIEAAKLRSEEPKGCRKLGLKIESNLVNEFDKKFSRGFPASTEETSAEWWRIKSLWIYPVKSCRGVELGRSNILATGMEFDRQFTFAQLKSPFPLPSDATESGQNAHRWEFITQRQFAQLARVRTQIWAPDPSVHSYEPHCQDVENGGVLIISFPYQQPGWKGKLAYLGARVKGAVPEKSFRVPFDPTQDQIEKSGYKYEKMTIWKDTVNALNMEVEIPEEMRNFLGISNKLGLFRVDNQELRKVFRCAPKAEELGFQPVTGFQDAVSRSCATHSINADYEQYPLHLINLASVRDVERQMPRGKGVPRLSATRFRANIISKLFAFNLGDLKTDHTVTGPEMYTEDTWKKIKIGFYEYAVSCRTARCKMPNVDQDTGDRHESEPDHTLRTTRNVDEGAGPHIGCLGMQMCPMAKESAIRVGDELIVLEHGEHKYIPQ